MIKYKVKLDDLVQAIFNNEIKSDSKRSKAMSLYLYLQKHSYVNEEGVRVVNRSLAKLCELFNRTRKMSESYMNGLVNLMVELGLLFKQGRTIFFNSLEEINRRKKGEKKEIQKPTQSVDITSLESDEEKHKYRNIEINNTNTYTLYTDCDQSVSNDAIATEKEIETTTSELLKDLGIKSKNVKREVLSKLTNRKINVLGLTKYVLTVIKEKNEQRLQRNSYYIPKKSYAKNTQVKPCSNFEERTYDYDKLERQLLGWE